MEETKNRRVVLETDGTNIRIAENTTAGVLELKQMLLEILKKLNT